MRSYIRLHKLFVIHYLLFKILIWWTHESCSSVRVHYHELVLAFVVVCVVCHSPGVGGLRELERLRPLVSYIFYYVVLTVFTG